MAETRRLFAGIALDDAARAACAQVSERLRATGFAARYEDASKYHLTLAFLGNVDPMRVAEAGAALARAASQCAPVAFELDKLAAFPHERKPHVVYIGTRDAGRGYRTLAQAVREAFAALGFSFDDDAVAHATIARTKESKRPLPLLDVPAIRVAAGEVSLFESLFDPAARTSRYTILFAHPLGGQAAPRAAGT